MRSVVGISTPFDRASPDPFGASLIIVETIVKAAFLYFTLDERLSRLNQESGFHDFSSSNKTALPQNGGFRRRKVSAITDQSTWFMASLMELVASPIELMAFSIELVAS
jgi:hypothetical protein